MALLYDTPTAKWGLHRISGNSSANQLNEGIAQLAADVDALLAPVVQALTAQQVRQVGEASQIAAGRDLAAADFTALLARAAAVGVFGLGGLTNLGSGGALVNKGAITFTTGIGGAAASAAQFTGSTAQVLYIADTGGSDPFRLKTGSWGCWLRCAKRATLQFILSKFTSAPAYTWGLGINTGNTLTAVGDTALSGSLGAGNTAVGATNVCDDRWHFAVATFDGTTLRLYVDGQLEAQTVVTTAGQLAAGVTPFNVGGYAGDGSTASISPFFGRVDEAFVTPDVLTEDEVRLLMCARIAHGQTNLPNRAILAVRRRKRGGALATSDFPSTPVRLYNFVAGAVTDQGSANVGISGGGGGTIASVAAPDGTRDGAYHFAGAHTGLSSTDAGLPAALAARSYGCWTKMQPSAVLTRALMGWGTTGSADARLMVDTGGIVSANSGSDVAQGTQTIADNLWHHIVAVEDNAAVDGLRRKLYVDGRLVGHSTVMTSLTLAGAARFRVGASPDGTVPHVGQLTRAFVFAGALTSEQVAALYAVGSGGLPPSDKEPGMHVEAIDASSVYVLFDTLEPQHQVDLRVGL